MICRVFATASEALATFQDPNPFTGSDPSLYRVYAAIDATTPTVAYVRNLHETRQGIFARYRHADAGGHKLPG